jgi:hypothetical protein
MMAAAIGRGTHVPPMVLAEIAATAAAAMDATATGTETIGVTAIAAAMGDGGPSAPPSAAAHRAAKMRRVKTLSANVPRGIRLRVSSRRARRWARKIRIRPWPRAARPARRATSAESVPVAAGVVGGAADAAAAAVRAKA